MELESLTYHESASASKQEPPPLSRPAAEPKQIKLHSQWYQRTDDIARQKHARPKSSHIWGEGKGFAIVHETTAVDKDTNEDTNPYGHRA